MVGPQRIRAAVAALEAYLRNPPKRTSKAALAGMAAANEALRWALGEGDHPYAEQAGAQTGGDGSLLDAMRRRWEPAHDIPGLDDSSGWYRQVGGLGLMERGELDRRYGPLKEVH